MSGLPLNLLLLPLLGGFVFVSRWNPSRFVMLRAEGYRFLFHSALAGLSLLFLSALLASALPKIPPRFLLEGTFRFVNESWSAVAPVPYSGTAVLSLILGSLLWWPLNYLFPSRDYQVDSVIDRKADSLELLMRRAMGEARPVVIHLKNRELCVGYIISNFNPIFHIEYVRLLPLKYGYRKKDESHVYLLKDYEKDYLAWQTKTADWKTRLKRDNQSTETILALIEADERLRNLEMVLPIAEIESVAIYDLTLNRQHQ